LSRVSAKREEGEREREEGLSRFEQRAWRPPGYAMGFISKAVGQLIVSSIVLGALKHKGAIR
jgi:hypothetical protein